MILTLLGAAEEKKKRKPNVPTVAPIGGKKSAHTFLPPEKKEHLEDFTVEAVGGNESLG